MNETWGQVWNALQEELSLPSAGELTRTATRLVVAVLLGAVLGYDRERKDSAAGLRTHMLVALGAALFVIVPQQAGMDRADLSRIIQGVVAGIGFLGAGAIIKLSEKEQIKGLTTAAGIWATAAIGVAAGMGHELTAVLSALLALVILAVLPRVEAHIERRRVIEPEQSSTRKQGT
jgi:putative Mg2+ transporter-C (MgtC) family protein